MKPIWKFATPVLVLVAAGIGARAMLASPPEPERRERPANLRAVEAVRVEPATHPVVIRARGTVRPAVRTTLVPEVTGRVVELHPGFVVGGAFEADAVLVRIDARDYEIAVTGAAASVAQAAAALAEQRALAEQAAADWRSLGRSGSPSALTLREPQLAAAEANLEAARAELDRARLDLARTRLVAPYAGRTLQRDIDAGEFVSRGSPIGVLHGIESLEVALPLAREALGFIDVEAIGGTSAPAVEVRLGDGDANWGGELVRVEGVDAATQQTSVVARIEPVDANTGAPLRVGSFVEASIAGAPLTDVYPLPRAALREGREVLVFDEADGTVGRREVDVVRIDADVAVLGGGLSPGEVVVITPLATVADGTPVRATIDGVAPPPEPADEPSEARDAAAPAAAGGAG